MKKSTKERITSPKWGLFEQSFWKHPIVWLKDLKIYRNRIRHLKKFGYSPQAQWETFAWFIDIARDLLTYYRYERNGTGWYLEDNLSATDEENKEFYNSELDKMLGLLDDMDENLHPIETRESHDKMLEACEEFFRMFAKYFYGFWD